MLSMQLTFAIFAQSIVVVGWLLRCCRGDDDVVVGVVGSHHQIFALNAPQLRFFQRCLCVELDSIPSQLFCVFF